MLVPPLLVTHACDGAVAVGGPRRFGFFRDVLPPLARRGTSRAASLIADQITAAANRTTTVDS
jgi:hypothetical protein